MSLKLSLLTAEEVPLMREVSESLFYAYHSPGEFNWPKAKAYWQDVVNKRTGAIIVVSNEEKIIGAVCFELFDCFYNNRVWSHEWFLWVLPEYSRTKALPLLLKAYCQTCNLLGVDDIMLGTPIHMTSTSIQKMYKNLGFQPLETLWVRRT